MRITCSSQFIVSINHIFRIGFYLLLIYLVPMECKALFFLGMGIIQDLTKINFILVCMRKKMQNIPVKSRRKAENGDGMLATFKKASEKGLKS